MNTGQLLPTRGDVDLLPARRPAERPSAPSIRNTDHLRAGPLEEDQFSKGIELVAV